MNLLVFLLALSINLPAMALTKEEENRIACKIIAFTESKGWCVENLKKPFSEKDISTCIQGVRYREFQDCFEAIQASSQ